MQLRRLLQMLSDSDRRERGGGGGGEGLTEGSLSVALGGAVGEEAGPVIGNERRQLAGSAEVNS